MFAVHIKRLGGILPKGHFTPENVVKFWQILCMPLDFGGFLHISGFLFHRGGGTDINWNNPRRCVCGNSISGKILQINFFQIVSEENLLFSHIGRSTPIEIQ